MTRLIRFFFSLVLFVSLAGCTTTTSTEKTSLSAAYSSYEKAVAEKAPEKIKASLSKDYRKMVDGTGMEHYFIRDIFAGINKNIVKVHSQTEAYIDYKGTKTGCLNINGYDAAGYPWSLYVGFVFEEGGWKIDENGERPAYLLDQRDDFFGKKFSERAFCDHRDGKFNPVYTDMPTRTPDEFAAAAKQCTERWR